MDDHITQEVPPPTRTAQPWLKPTRRSVWPRLAWIMFALLVVAGLAWVIFRPHAAPPAGGGRFGGNAPMAVVTAEAVKGEIPVTLNGLGTVTPLAMVTVRTQINGQLTQIAFTEGQQVTKGDFLAHGDPRPYQAALDQATRQLLRDQPLQHNAELDLARFRKLAAQDSIAKQQVDTQQSLVNQLEGTVKTDQALVDN